MKKQARRQKKTKKTTLITQFTNTFNFLPTNISLTYINTTVSPFRDFLKNKGLNWNQYIRLLHLSTNKKPRTYRMDRKAMLAQHRIQHGQRGWGGWARNMKYKGPTMAAIFFMTSFNRDRGAMAPLPPPGSAAVASLLASYQPLPDG